MTRYTKLEREILENLDKGLDEMKRKASYEVSGLNYTERLIVIKIQETKIEFFKKGLLFRARQEEVQMKIFD